jgi:hypothetical protein
MISVAEVLRDLEADRSRYLAEGNTKEAESSAEAIKMFHDRFPGEYVPADEAQRWLADLSSKKRRWFTEIFVG